MNRVQHLPIHATGSGEVIAFALIDDPDYPRVSPFRWVMQGAPQAPHYVYRYRRRLEREAHTGQKIGLAQQLLPQADWITFRNGDPLDFRRANLLGRQERTDRQQRSAAALAAATVAGEVTCRRPLLAADAWHVARSLPTAESMDQSATGLPSPDALYPLPLSQEWTAWIDPEWVDRVTPYRWCVQTRRAYAFAQRRVRLGDGCSRVIYLARVVVGLQDAGDGAALGEGVVALRTPPDAQRRTLDLRAANLLVTTRAGANLNRPTKARYRGVQAQRGKYRAMIRLDGYDRVIGLFETPVEAARARDAEIVRLGLADIARMNDGPGETTVPDGPPVVQPG
jgi:hypothetical protein